MVFNLKDLPDLTGRIYIVTGGNTGIGYATCAHLATHGARVYMGARSADKANTAIANIKSSYPEADMRHLKMDLMSLKSINEAAAAYMAQETRLHALINNAGIMGTEFLMTEDGNESQWQTNYLGHWLFTRKLLPILLATAADAATPRGAVRIVNVSSSGHKLYAPKGGISIQDPDLKSAGTMTRYGQSKLANVLHAKTLNALYGPGSALEKSGKGVIYTASLDPGPVDTALNTQVKVPAMGWLQPVLKCLGVYSTIEEGATASLFTGGSDQFVDDMSGQYFDKRAGVSEASKYARDETLMKQLESWTEGKMRTENWIE